METCFANLVEPGDKVVVCINGVFGMRMQENITRFGGVAVVVEDDWGTAVSLDKVEQALKDNTDAKKMDFKPSLVSFIMPTKAGSRCPIVGRAIADRMRGCTSLGPGPISVLIGGLNDFIVL
jgi:alanine-glyoxylate transaminase/serine-glyoxylate transaminase/serine-pyruvate transaminase